MAAKHKKANASGNQGAALRSMNEVRGRIAQAAMIFVLVIFVIHPLFIDSMLYSDITRAKQTFFKACTILFYISVILFSLTVSGFYRKLSFKKLVLAIRAYEWPLVALFLVMLVSTILADSIKTALHGSSDRNEGLFMMLLYFGACVLVGRLYKPKSWIFYTLCATAAVVAIYGFFQYHGLDFLGLHSSDPKSQAGSAFLFFSTMSNRNVASTYFCLAFCISLVMFSHKTQKMHWIYLPLGLILFYALLIGQTESGYVGLVVSMGLAFPFIVSTRQAAARFFSMLAGCLGVMWLETTIALSDPVYNSYWMFLRPYLLPGAAALLLISAALFFIKLPLLPVKASRIGWYALLIVLAIVFIVVTPQLAARTGNTSFQQLADILQGDMDDSFMSGRMMVWKRSLTMIPDRILFGYGPDNFATSFNAIHRGAVLEAQNMVYDKLHNEYLQILFDNGILGLLSMLGFYGAMLFLARKKLNNPMVLAIIVALICHMAQAFFNFVSPFAHPVAWTLWGVLGALLYTKEQETEIKAI